MSSVVTQSAHKQTKKKKQKKKQARTVILAQTWVCYCKASEGDSKLSHVGTTGYFCRTPLMPVECHMGMVYHPHRTFCTTGALYFSADHTSGLLLERLLDCIIVLCCLLSIYIYTGNSATSAVLFYMSAVNLCWKFYKQIWKLFSVQKSVFTAGFAWTSSSISG